MYRVGFRRDNVLKVWLVTTAAVLAICLLAFVETTSMAEAASLPHNGKIVFSSFGGHDGDHDIYTVEPDGSNLSRLTDDNTYLDIRPSWSPDGKKIVFERELVTGGRGKHWVMVMGADGSNMRKLPVRTRSSNVSWSPDGTKLTFDVGNPRTLTFATST